MDLRSIVWKRMLPFVLTPALTSQAFAYTTYSGALTSIGTDWNGAGYIFTVSAVTNACSTSSFEITPSNAGYKDQLATLMVAWTLGEQVTIVTDASDTCAFNREMIISVQIAGP